MKTRAAILDTMELPRPYTKSQPLRVEEVTLALPEAGEVLVEVAGAGLCHSDLSTINGTRPWPLPMVLGHEASGTVLEVGADVHSFRPGDHVVFSFVPTCGRCLPCSTGRPALCEPGLTANRAGALLSGARRLTRDNGQTLHHHLGVAGFARHTVVAQESLVKIDTAYSLTQAALFGCAVLTGVGAVVNTARVEAGKSVAVFGLGGVGLCAILGARLAGAYPILAVDPLPAKRELALSLGATVGVDAVSTGKTVVEAIADLTRGGVDYAFESVGSELVLAQAYSATRRGGTTIAIGLPHPTKQLTISAASLVAEERTLKGSYMGSAVPRRDIPRFLALHQAGLLPVESLLTRTISLDQINQGFDDLAEGRAVRQLITFG